MKNKIKNLIFINHDFKLANFIIVVVLIMKFVDIKYETNDDWYMGLIVQGFFGEGTNQYLVFSNVILEHIFSTLCGGYLITNDKHRSKIIEIYLKENYENDINSKFIDNSYCVNNIYLVYAYV